MKKSELLVEIKKDLDGREEERLSPWACLSRHAVRRKEEVEIDRGHRQNFSVDTDLWHTPVILTRLRSFI